MLSPKPVASVESLCDDLIDENSVGRSATSFTVLSKDRREIDWDGLKAPVKVCKQPRFTTTIVGTWTVIDISFQEAVNPGERLALFCSITIKNCLSRQSSFHRSLGLKYFWGPQETPPGTQVIRADLGIPCLTLYTGDPTAPRVAGGFDIIVCHPRSYTASAVPNPSLPQGALYRKGQPFGTQIWRLRSLTTAREILWRTHGFDLRVDLEIPSTWIVFWLTIVVSAIVSLLVSLAVPWFQTTPSAVGTPKALAPSAATAPSIPPQH